MRRPSPRLPATWLGVNFRSRGPQLWRDYDPAAVREELAALARHRLTVTRFFCSWPDYHPEPDRIADFLDAHAELALSSVPTFLVGWADAEQARPIEQITRRLHDHPAVAGWMISNETPGHDAPTDWVQPMVRAVRAGGAKQPVSVGDGFAARELAPINDFTTPRGHPTDSDPVRQNLDAAFRCELAAVDGNPVVLEGFGLSGPVLHTTMLAGATGWLARSDTASDRSALRELDRFAHTLSEVDFDRVRRADTDVALVVSSHDERRRTLESLRQAYVMAREADLAPGFSREDDGIAGDAWLYLLPSVRELPASTLRRLGDLARGGATVYLSCRPGDREPFPGLPEFFGVRQDLRHAPILEDVVSMRFVEDFGYLRADQVLRFAVSGDGRSRAFLPVTPSTAEVLAVDDHDRPFLLRNRVGDGWAVLCAYPLEHMAAGRANVNPEAGYRLYQALAAAAGVRREATVDDPLVFADVLVHEDGRRFQVLVSQHDGAVEVSPLEPAAGWGRG